jgi:outer membrane receptor protein involved in Fe transport
MVEGGFFKPRRWRYSFVTLLLASASALPAIAATDASSGGATVQEVVVTATKRTANLQSVPVSIQALTPTVLDNHQVVALDDYVKLLPSVSFQSLGPGQSQIYFRGISSGGDGLHSGSEPATGVYVDETPLTTIANGVDLHVYDVARVEALSGPQGTLFGASSLSGTLRIITNQPSTKAFSAGFDLQGDTFTKGGPGARSFGDVAEGFINVPINDKAAIRLVAFDEHDGGYVDNVLHQRTFQLSPGSDPATGDTLTENNAKYVKQDFNTIDTYGGRAALKIDLDDHWTITPAVIYQHQVANGNWLVNPRLGDLVVSDFSRDLNVDRWYQASLTIQGKIANWDVVYAGGDFARTVDNQNDYSYYSVAYDNNPSLGPAYVTFPDGHGGFLDPDQKFRSHDDYTKQSHEFRINSPSDYFVRGLFGVFYERQTDHENANFFVPGLAASGSSLAVPDAGDDIFYKNLHRTDRDFAAFGELAWDILPNLTLTSGVRYFTVDNTLVGFSGLASYVTDPICVATTLPDIPCENVNAEVKESGETHKVNLSWKIDPQRMVYFTYSTGFRPGGVNRTPGSTYRPDTLTNFELGWKTTWLDGRLRLNGALFDEEWHDVQYALAPPDSNGITSIYNAGNARSYGLEGDAVWRATDNLTLSASGTLLDAKLTTTFINVPESGPTQIAPAGTRLPVQPRYKLNGSARYNFTFASFNDFIEADVQTQGDSTSALFEDEEAVVGKTAPFTTVDLSAGVARDNWNLSVFVQNVGDTRGVLSKNSDCAISICGPYALDYLTKPRFAGVKLGAKF